MERSSEYKGLPYERPEALRLAGELAAKGGFACTAPGSGDPGCHNGNDAFSCEDSGSAATQECELSGSGAIGDCIDDGSSVTQ